MEPLTDDILSLDLGLDQAPQDFTVPLDYPASTLPSSTELTLLDDDSPLPARRNYRDRPQPAPTNHWDPRLVLDLAIGVDGMEDILSRYDLSMEEYNAITAAPAFRRELALAIREVRENGLTFAAKVRVQAENYLGVLDDLVYDDATPASTRLEAIRSAVRWGRLEPKESKEEQGQATQVNVQINF